MLNQRKSAFVYFEALAGSGHAAIASHLTRALQRNNIDTYVLAAPSTQQRCINFDFGTAYFINLPDLIRAKGFGRDRFITDKGLPYPDDEEFQITRFNAIFSAIEQFKPDILITLSYPIGRGSRDKELIPAFEKIRKNLNPAPYIVTVARDVGLYGSEIEREWLGKDFNSDAAEAVRIINEYYDSVIVTGDSHFITLNESFPQVENIRIPLHYSGYFADAVLNRTENMAADKREVVVSTGAGYKDVYRRFYSAAMQARAYSQFSQNPWRFFISDDCPEKKFHELKQFSIGLPNSRGITVERNRPDFRQAITDSAAIVSFGGRNTTIEALSIKEKYDVPVIMYPLKTPGLKMSEQQLRVQKLLEMGIIGMLKDSDLDDPKAFAACIDKTAQTTFQSKIHIDMNGSEQAINVILAGLAKKRGISPTVQLENRLDM